MNLQLSLDEYQALEQITQLSKGARPSACIARNSKRLIGIKMIAHRRDGSFELTELGRQTLFIKQCIDGMRLLANQTDAQLSKAVLTFLAKKGHVEHDEANGQTRLSARGRECLADIDSQTKPDKAY